MYVFDLFLCKQTLDEKHKLVCAKFYETLFLYLLMRFFFFLNDLDKAESILSLFWIVICKQLYVIACRLCHFLKKICADGI